MSFVCSLQIDGKYFWWFEVVELFRKLILNGVMVYIKEGTAQQIMVGLLIW